MINLPKLRKKENIKICDFICLCIGQVHQIVVFRVIFPFLFYNTIFNSKLDVDKPMCGMFLHLYLLK
jgi:hypothetical protein